MSFATDRVMELFLDVRSLHGDALEMLEQGKIRNAAEKAWGATKRATDALLLARTGEEPRTSGQTHRGIRTLGRSDSMARDMAQRYSSRQTDLHGACFYDGNCDPEEEVIRDIQDTIDFILDAERLAEAPYGLLAAPSTPASYPSSCSSRDWYLDGHFTSISWV